MREASHIVAECLNYVGSLVRPGVTPMELNTEVERFIVGQGAYPAFKGYKVGRQRFEYAACVSVNSAVVHGIPSREPLRTGDIISIDCGAEKDGWYGDGAWTFAVGEISAATQQC